MNRLQNGLTEDVEAGRRLDDVVGVEPGGARPAADGVAGVGGLERVRQRFVDRHQSLVVLVRLRRPRTRVELPVACTIATVIAVP